MVPRSFNATIGAMTFLYHLRELPSMRPFDLRMVLDDQLLAVYNQVARLKEHRWSAELTDSLAQNIRHKDRHRGERCWIIGNGPSIREQDLTQLHGETTFVVNRFMHHPEAEQINPNYYVMVDPKFGTGEWGTDFVEQLDGRLPDVELFLTREGRDLVRDRGILANHHKWVVYPNQQWHFGYRHEVDLCRGVPGGSNVTKTAIAIAIYMGFGEINLLGIDGNGLILEANSHFYGHEQRDDNQPTFEKNLMSMSMALRGWRAIATYLERRDVALTSMNPKSVLTGLPQAPFVV